MQDKIEHLIKNASFPASGAAGSLSTGLLNGGSSQNSQVTDTIQQATEQIQALKDVTQTNADSIAANTDALTDSSQSSPSVGGRIGDSVGQAASSLLSGGGLLGGSSGGLGGLLGGGLLGGGLGALFSGISSLFGGGPSQPAPLTQYLPPDKQDFNLADTNGQVTDSVNDSYGQPRAASFTELALSGLQPATQSANSASNGVPSGSAPSAQSTQVTVQVQAMDSQSFLDRSGDIAQAVRQAMLNMHSINDVVNDL